MDLGTGINTGDDVKLKDDKDSQSVCENCEIGFWPSNDLSSCKRKFKGVQYFILTLFSSSSSSSSSSYEQLEGLRS